MTRASSHFLDSGDVFPALDIDTVNHGVISLPDYWTGSWGVLVIYRAHW